jgi:hypothetical protein
VAYVREKKVPGKGGKVYRYYQLVEGRRVDGKVRQHVIQHLGKHDSIGDARAYAKAYAKEIPDEAVVPKDRLKKLKEINAEYVAHFWAWIRRGQESNDIYYELKSLEGVRSRAATAQRARLEERQAEISVLHDKAQAFLPRAGEIFDKLSPAQQESVRALPWAVIDHLETGRDSSEIARRLSIF